VRRTPHFGGERIFGQTEVIHVREKPSTVPFGDSREGSELSGRNMRFPTKWRKSRFAVTHLPFIWRCCWWMHRRSVRPQALVMPQREHQRYVDVNSFSKPSLDRRYALCGTHNLDHQIRPIHCPPQPPSLSNR
jgi:hypothetical protein